ncbi:hypothetical protein HanIR_Chr08g0357781 [Helianthus annuus]|nr:hypothetical protein HanIR_Chr08g0357781 [Helianthus annuus]
MTSSTETSGELLTKFNTHVATCLMAWLVGAQIKVLHFSFNKENNKTTVFVFRGSPY